MSAFDLVLPYLHSVIVVLNDDMKMTWRQSLCRLVLMKIHAHCATMRRLAPDSAEDFPQDRDWDPASISAIARCVVEAHGTFVYFAKPSPNDQVDEFEYLLWDLHQAERSVMLSEKFEYEPEVTKQYRDVMLRMRHRVKCHPLFNQVVSQDNKGRWRKDGDSVHLAITPKDICEAENIPWGLYRYVVDRLSQDVHSFPLGLENLRKSKLSHDNALDFIAMPFSYCLPFLCRVGLKCRTCFGDCIPEPDESVQRILEAQRCFSESWPPA